MGRECVRTLNPFFKVRKWPRMHGVLYGQGSSDAVQGVCWTALMVLCPNMKVAHDRDEKNAGTVEGKWFSTRLVNDWKELPEVKVG